MEKKQQQASSLLIVEVLYLDLEDLKQSKSYGEKKKLKKEKKLERQKVILPS